MSVSLSKLPTLSSITRYVPCGDGFLSTSPNGSAALHWNYGSVFRFFPSGVRTALSPDVYARRASRALTPGGTDRWEILSVSDGSRVASGLTPLEAHSILSRYV